jgi:hypothetical protein
MVVVGGMLFSTFLTLVIVPVVYTMLAGGNKKKTLSAMESENNEEMIPDRAETVQV